MRIFKELEFKRQKIESFSGRLESSVVFRAYILGVNSGAYDKNLHITVVQRKPFKFHTWLKWKFGTEECMNAEINLSVREMIELRDEIDKILRLPFDKEAIK